MQMHDHKCVVHLVISCAVAAKSSKIKGRDWSLITVLKELQYVCCWGAWVQKTIRAIIVVYTFLATWLLNKELQRSIHICTVFIPIPAHAPITAHQRHIQFKICGTINRPLKSSHPMASNYVPSPVLNTENQKIDAMLILIYSTLDQ